MSSLIGRKEDSQLRLLMIGIDGGTESIFDLFNLSFMNNLKNQSAIFPIKEDLIKRGWPQIITGLHAVDNSAFYNRPALDGTYSFVFKANLETYAKDNDAIPIWKMAENAGLAVGVCNVPTAYPAPSVNGFFICGQGGGTVLKSAIPSNFVWPHDLVAWLSKKEYVFDCRPGAQEPYKDAIALVEFLKKMMTKRTKVYIELAKQFSIDFGFICFRAPCVVQYLFMYQLMDQFINKNAHNQESAAWRDLLSNFYSAFDSCLSELFSALLPHHFVMVSDHSNVPYRHELDVNYFLAEHGYHNMHISLKKTINNVLKLFTNKNYIMQMRAIPKFRDKLSFLYGHYSDYRSSSAFGQIYVNGIYVNDYRFNGLVSSSDSIKIRDEIINRFNEDKRVQELGLIASPYRDRYKGARYEELAPDIIIEGEGELFFTPAAGCFIRPNECYIPVSINTPQPFSKRGMQDGQKGVWPLLMVDAESSKLHMKSDPNDLRLAYIISKRILRSEAF